MATKKEVKWPKNTKVRPEMQGRIVEAARKLAQLCIRADIDLSYVDRDGLLISVDRAEKPRKRRKASPVRGGLRE